MTTPQSILHNIEYKLTALLELLEGNFVPHEEGETLPDIYELCRSVEATCNAFETRLMLLEDKLNIIIKLLSKSHP
jgi:hypothetical protein